MYRPSFLQKGDKVALVSPAGAVEREIVEAAATELHSWGLLPLIGPHAWSKDRYFAGNDDERRSDMQAALDDEEIRAVFCTRGGYGCIRIVEKIDYSLFQGSPKWVIGYSDITVFHSKLNTLGIESLHAPMPSEYGYTDKRIMEETKSILFGRIPAYETPPSPLNREGSAKGELVGGNLSILHTIRSCVFEQKYKGNLIFIEDVGENLYAIDRMMQSMKFTGVLENIEGLIVGGCHKMKGEDFGKTAYEIIREAVDDYDYPVCFDFPAGHTKNNRPFLLGAPIEAEIKTSGGKINYVDDETSGAKRILSFPQKLKF